MFRIIYEPHSTLDKPYISVVITAYDRKEFIQEAVQSIIDQKLEREKFEIIVVKNFIDDRIDEFLSRSSVVNVYSDEKPLGAKLAYGIEKAKGEVISFLEDDDLFLPFKLGEVYEIFQDNKDIVYFKNEIIRLKNVKDASVRLKEIVDIPLDRQIFQGKELDSVAKISFMIRKFNGDFNLSSMSIRKEYYLSCIVNLNKVVNLLDFAIFIWPFFIKDEKLTLVFQKKPLSVWRVHESASNSGFNPSIGEIARKHILNMQIAIETLKIWINLLENYVSEDFVKEYTSLKTYFRLFINDSSLTMKLAKGEQLTPSEIANLLKFSRYRYRRDLYTFGLLFLAFLSYFTPSISGRIFRWAMWKFKF